MPEQARRAALLIIGNEILSGRTQDVNLRVLARLLRERGIQIAEARTVRDEPEAIITAVNELRGRYAYLFTSGGIGPTHDDITTACIAKALGRSVIRHPDAEANLREYYLGIGREVSEARMRMAEVAEGAELITCAETAAPGFVIDNVFVFAGVPAIFAGMAQSAMARLAAGPKLQSRSITVLVGESEAADDLAHVQDNHAQLELGSYPTVRDDGKHICELVISGTDTEAVNQALQELTGLLDKRDIPWQS